MSSVGEGMAGLAGKLSPDCVFGNEADVCKSEGCGVLSSAVGASSQIPTCPKCSSEKLWKDGLRYPMLGEPIQRWLCRDCGLRFSDPMGVEAALKALKQDRSLESMTLKSDVGIVGTRQICVSETKNLDSTTKTKIVVGDIEKLPQDSRGLLTKFAAYLEREGYYEDTSYFDLISSIANDGANLLNPEDVKEKIARHKFKDKAGKERPWKESVKLLTCYAYDSFCRMEEITWTKPKYKQQETILDIPDEKDLDALILSAQSKRMAAYLQTLKETYADPGEALAIEWKEIKGNVVAITHPCKGHLTGQYEVSARLIAMLNTLPKKDRRVFPTNYSTMYMCLNALKKKASHRLQNPRILDITFKSFRHWGGSMLAHYTNGNVLTVKKMLRHKCIENTMKYIHTLKF